MLKFCDYYETNTEQTSSNFLKNLYKFDNFSSNSIFCLRPPIMKYA